MKARKLILAASLLSFSAMSSAGIFSSIVTSDLKTKDPTANYKVSTYGYDVRVYEWTPKDNKNVRCVFVAGEENSSGVACYEVKGGE